jgi:hypothetical protein
MKKFLICAMWLCGCSKNHIEPTSVSITLTPPENSNFVILLDFDGASTNGTHWGDYTLTPSSIEGDAVRTVAQGVYDAFAPFGVVVTTDESLYHQFPISKRIRAVFTNTIITKQELGGISILNSVSFNDDTPVIIYSSVLNNYLPLVIRATIHEIGHGFGLRHQSDYDDKCVRVNEYSEGSGQTVPFMGDIYRGTTGVWRKGPSQLGCSIIQDDTAIIRKVIF